MPTACYSVKESIHHEVAHAPPNARPDDMMVRDGNGSISASHYQPHTAMAQHSARTHPNNQSQHNTTQDVNEPTVDQLKRAVERYRAQQDELAACIEQQEAEIERLRGKRGAEEVVRQYVREMVGLKRQLSDSLQEIARLKLQAQTISAQPGQAFMAPQRHDPTNDEVLTWPCEMCHSRVAELQAELDENINTSTMRLAELQQLQRKCKELEAIVGEQRGTIDSLHMHNVQTSALVVDRRADAELKEREDILNEKNSLVARKAAMCGDSFIRVGSLQEAINAYTIAIDLAGLKPCVGNRAYVYAQLGNAEKCLEDCDRFLAMDGASDGEIYLYRATSLHQLHRTEEAVHDLELGLKLKPSHTEMQQLLNRIRQARYSSGHPTSQQVLQVSTHSDVVVGGTITHPSIMPHSPLTSHAHHHHISSNQVLDDSAYSHAASDLKAVVASPARSTTIAAKRKSGYQPQAQVFVPHTAHTTSGEPTSYSSSTFLRRASPSARFERRLSSSSLTHNPHPTHSTNSQSNVPPAYIAHATHTPTHPHASHASHGHGHGHGHGIPATASHMHTSHSHIFSPAGATHGGTPTHGGDYGGEGLPRRLVSTESPAMSRLYRSPTQSPPRSPQSPIRPGLRGH